MKELEKLKKENDWLKSENEIVQFHSGNELKKLANESEMRRLGIIILQQQLDEANETLQIIHDIAIDYDGYRTVKGLKELIDEIRRLASDANKKA